MKKRVLVVGSSNMDFVMNVGKIPEAGQTVIEKREYDYVPGGKGANGALALARLGGDCIFCARLGNDANGQLLKKFYSDSGMDTRFVKLDKNVPTGLASIIVEENGNNRIVVYPGANSHLSSADVEDSITSLPDGVLLQFEIPEATVIAATQFASRKDIPIIVDAGPAYSGYPLGELAPLEIISPNESETYALTGVMPNTMDNCLRAATVLMQKVQTKYVVIKLGGRGAYIHDGRYSRLITPYECDVVDTTAAGDAFTAAMTLEYLKTGDIVKAVKYANVVGSMVVSKAGAASSIPFRTEVEEFIKANEIII